MKLGRFSLIAAVAAMSLSLAACGQSVPAGSVGVKVNNYGGNAGVEKTSLPVGWHGTGFGEDIVNYPVTQRVYNYKDGDAIQFTDNIGLQLAADIAVTIRVDPSKAPSIYEKYRLNTDQLIAGPVHTAVRSAVKGAASHLTSEQLYSGKDAEVLAQALSTLQKRYEPEGIEIIALDWIGNIRYPQSVLNAITLKTTKLQEAEAAKADEARATAQANAIIAEAKGEAEAMRIRGEAISANPNILREKWISKWDGTLPQTVAGGDASLMLNITK